VVIGAGPIGRQVTSRLETTGHDVCLIDLSPINLHPFAQEGFRTIAGDATDSATLAAAEANDAAVVVVCVPDDEVAARVVRKLREANRTGLVLVRCRFQVNAPKLRNGGADEVVSEEAVASNALLQLLDAHGKERPMPIADRRGHSPYA
jgi:CPA2 family monovalent cation:H+ antiporter-2